MSYTDRRNKWYAEERLRRNDVSGFRANGAPQTRSSLTRGAGVARKVKGRPVQARQRAQHESNGSMDRHRMREMDGRATITIDRRGLVKWMTENAITIAALEQLVTDRRVDQCVAFQQADGWFIVLVKLSRERDVRFLATFRELGKPRRFSRLDVLFKLLHDTLGYNGVIQVLPYSRAGVAKRLGAL